MNDILLVPSESQRGCYDLAFVSNDVFTVSGNSQLRNAVLHALLLRFGELDLVFYEDKGSYLGDYAKLTNTDSNRSIVVEEIRRVVGLVDGVMDAVVELDDSASGFVIRRLSVIRDTGVEVKII